MEVLQEERTSLASTLGAIGVWHRHAIASGVDRLRGSRVAVILVLTVGVVVGYCR